jgi:SHS2 domain-containing protein
MGYEYLDVSGDAGVRAVGGTLGEAFQEAALGMYGLITDPEGVREAEEHTIEVRREGPEELLVAWLNELIYLFDTRGFIGRSVNVRELTGERLAAVVRGEVFDTGRHDGGLVLKAATYHGLRLEQRDDGGWVAEVIFDI